MGRGPVLKIGSTIYSGTFSVTKELDKLFNQGYLGVDWTFLTIYPDQNVEAKINSLRSEFLKRAPTFKKVALPPVERRWWEISAPSYEDYD